MSKLILFSSQPIDWSETYSKHTTFHVSHSDEFQKGHFWSTGATLSPRLCLCLYLYLCNLQCKRQAIPEQIWKRLNYKHYVCFWSFYCGARSLSSTMCCIKIGDWFFHFPLNLIWRSAYIQDNDVKSDCHVRGEIILLIYWRRLKCILYHHERKTYW